MRDQVVEAGRLRTNTTGRWRWDVASGRVSWSPELYELFGLPPGATLSLESYLEHVHPLDRARTRSTIERALQAREGFDHYERIVRPDGRVRWLHSQGYVFVGERGEVSAMHGVCTDLGNYVSGEPGGGGRPLEHDSVASIAHDLNNLLSAITMGAELTEWRSLDTETQDVMRRVRTAAEHARGLTEALQAVARDDAVAEQDVDVAQTLRDFEPVLGVALRERRLTLHVCPDPIMVRLRPGVLERVVLNLCLNARRATDAGGSIEVRLTRTPAGCWAMLSICDDGQGMANGALERAFQPSYSTKNRGRHGLGLAGVRSLVEGAGGNVELQSAEGKGTRATILLPVAQRR